MRRCRAWTGREAARWTFDPPDFEKFPLLKLAYQAQEAGGSATATLNAADEIAVEAFLAGEIPFPGDRRDGGRNPRAQCRGASRASIAEVLEIDRDARASRARGGSHLRLGVGKARTEARGSARSINSRGICRFLQNIWWYLVLIGVMILIHELGHYWAARFFDVKVETFSFGFGPRLFGFRKRRNRFPFLGDPVRRLREHGRRAARRRSRQPIPARLLAKPRWQRLIIAFAGPAINVVLAVVLLTGLFMVRVPQGSHAAFSNRRLCGAGRPGGARPESAKATRWCRSTTSRTPPGKISRSGDWAACAARWTCGCRRDGQRMHFTVTPAYDEKQARGKRRMGSGDGCRGRRPGSGHRYGAQRAGLRKGRHFCQRQRPVRSAPPRASSR